jgi:hypothetical protein
MSFGNRSNYCSLEMAFGTKLGAQEDLQLYNKEQHSVGYKIPQGERIKEDFNDDASDDLDVGCEKSQLHCAKCPDCLYKKKSYGPIGTNFNEILNIILILSLMWIIIYKPSF